MNPAPAFERVYPALREWLTSGRLRPGDRLEPGYLAQELQTSVMPVRDALQRLVGERIAATGRMEGFTLPRFSEADLRDLYTWNRHLMIAALSGRSGDGIGDRPAMALQSLSYADRIASLFSSIAHRSTNYEHRHAVASTSARLHAARLAEPHVLPDVAVEAAALETMLATGNLVELRHAVTAYHRRRLPWAAQILRRMEAP